MRTRLLAMLVFLIGLPLCLSAIAREALRDRRRPQVIVERDEDVVGDASTWGRR